MIKEKKTKKYRISDKNHQIYSLPNSDRLANECSSAFNVLTTGLLVIAGFYLCIPLIQIHIVSVQTFIEIKIVLEIYHFSFI